MKCETLFLRNYLRILYHRVRENRTKNKYPIPLTLHTRFNALIITSKRVFTLSPNWVGIGSAIKNIVLKLELRVIEKSEPKN